MIPHFFRAVPAFLDRRPAVLVAVVLLLLVPALLINLGLLPLTVDEPIRALVALELRDSGNYFLSTMQGVLYYNKPPLYNWMLLGVFWLFGNESEWTIRIPTVFFLLTFALSIWLIVRRYLGNRVGVITALAFVTSGRILYYDSFQGLIDMSYSWVTYLSFMAIFYFAERRQWVWLFVVSYGLTAVGFMLKGLPSLVFQGLMLAVFFGYTGRWRRLFSWQHVVGGLVLLALIGAYFYQYSRYNSLDTYFRTLWTESSKRTVAAHTWQDSVVHFFVFPFDFLRNFLPWTLLLVCCLHRDFWRAVRANPFLSFNLAALLAPLPIYWFSPSTIPRYLFMLVPQLMTLLVYAYFQFGVRYPVHRRIVDGLLLGISAGLAVAMLLPLFFPSTRALPLAAFKSLGLFLLLAALTALLYHLPNRRLLLLAAVLLAARIGFDWFVLPLRVLPTADKVQYRRAGVTVGQLTKGQPLYLYPRAYLDNDIAFYITRERGAILRTAPRVRPDTYYLAETRQLRHARYTSYYRFFTDEDHEELQLVKFSQGRLPHPPTSHSLDARHPPGEGEPSLK